jgi:hypothetical protein
MPNGLYSNIPAELRQLKNWCLWKFIQTEGRKPTKVPYTPAGHKCSVTNPENFSSFDECFNVLAIGHYDGLGFIFTGTEYSGIDLDDPTFLADGSPNPNYQSDLNRQIKIAHEFDSYSEVSPSGKGLHIIVKGKVPDGRRTNYIELYPSGRYFTMTGQVHNPKPVVAYQELLNQLWSQMGGVVNGTPVSIASQPETTTDDEILELARKHNAATFTDLEAGLWVGSYPSQSEADQAYLNIIAYYTNSRAQVERIFRNSKLMRDKANKNKGYLPSSINKAFDMKVAPINLGDYKNALEDKLARDQLELNLNGSVAQLVEPAAHNGSVAGSSPATPTTAPPPGLLGEIAQFVYAQAPRPVPEIALAAAIGLLAGIVGRAYNINGTGLNQYVLVLAKTGRGKEAAALGIDKLMNAVKMQVPTSTSFRGPGDINSGQSLVKYLNHTSRCFVSVIGEFGITIDRISQPYANSADKMLYKLLLDLYNKSGFGQTVQASIYSKKEDSTGVTESPAVTILGESTHKLFYGALTEDMIAAGLLPRFLIIDYDGDRVPNNENAHLVQPSFKLIEQFASLIAQCEITMSANRRIDVQYTKDAFQLLKNFDKLADTKINSARDDVVAELWNRAHMKALRLSALIAVGVNMIEPMITVEYAQWAINLVQNDIRILSSRFEAGEVGTSSHEIKQAKEIIRVIKDYCSSDYDKVKKYVTDKSQGLHKDKVIPYVYLNRRLSAASVFRLDRAGATVALKRAIQNLVDSDRLKELGKVWAQEKYGTSQRCFVVSDLSLLD